MRVPFSPSEMAILDAAAPVEVMKFVLTYEGPLGSNKQARQSWALRRAFHPQLEELWSVNQALGNAKFASVPEVGGRWLPAEEHHSVGAPLGGFDPPLEEYITRPDGRKDRYLCCQIERHGHRFVPLVRESMALICDLHVLFLRKDDAGALIKQGGDLDNRIKTLFDGLRMPSKGDEPFREQGELPAPLYCLLEEDSLVASFGVEGGRLLTKLEGDATDVKLVITVTVKAAHVRSYNLPLLGE